MVDSHRPWLAAIGLVASLAASPSWAQDIRTRWREMCAACHGAAGQSEQPEVPHLGGQPMLFVAFQLFLFREGRRTGTPLADAMTEVAKTLSDSDLRAYSEFIATLPPPPPPNGPVDDARMRRGAAIVGARRCETCHNPDMSGREQMARLAGQREDYLIKAFAEYQAGRRVGAQAVMIEAVAGLTSEQLVDLAYALQRWRN